MKGIIWKYESKHVKNLQSQPYVWSYLDQCQSILRGMQALAKIAAIREMLQVGGSEVHVFA